MFFKIPQYDTYTSNTMARMMGAHSFPVHAISAEKISNSHNEDNVKPSWRK